MSESKPNILFLFPDQLRHDWIAGVSPIPVRTPNLDRLRRQGMTFSRAVCPSPLCAPCRASLALGVEYHHSPVKSNRENLPLEAPPVYRLLRAAGYHVTGCGKFDLNKGDCIAGKPAWGLDGKLHLDEWGFSDGVNNEGKMDGVNSGRRRPQGPYLQYLEERGLRQAHIDDFARRDKTRTHRNAVFAALGAWRMVYDGCRKLIFDPEKGDCLFDLEIDPGENANRIDDPRYREIVAKLTRIAQQQLTPG